MRAGKALLGGGTRQQGDQEEVWEEEVERVSEGLGEDPQELLGGGLYLES